MVNVDSTTIEMVLIIIIETIDIIMMVTTMEDITTITDTTMMEIIDTIIQEDH